MKLSRYALAAFLVSSSSSYVNGKLMRGQRALKGEGKEKSSKPPKCGSPKSSKGEDKMLANLLRCNMQSQMFPVASSPFPICAMSVMEADVSPMLCPKVPDDEECPGVDVNDFCCEQDRGSCSNYVYQCCDQAALLPTLFNTVCAVSAGTDKSFMSADGIQFMPDCGRDECAGFASADESCPFGHTSLAFFNSLKQGEEEDTEESLRALDCADKDADLKDCEFYGDLAWGKEFSYTFTVPAEKLYRIMIRNAEVIRPPTNDRMYDVKINGKPVYIHQNPAQMPGPRKIADMTYFYYAPVAELMDVDETMETTQTYAESINATGTAEIKIEFIAAEKNAVLAGLLIQEVETIQPNVTSTTT